MVACVEQPLKEAYELHGACELHGRGVVGQSPEWGE